MTTETESRQLFTELRAGDRIEVEHEVKEHSHTFCRAPAAPKN